MDFQAYRALIVDLGSNSGQCLTLRLEDPRTFVVLWNPGLGRATTTAHTKSVALVSEHRATLPCCMSGIEAKDWDRVPSLAL